MNKDVNTTRAVPGKTHKTAYKAETITGVKRYNLALPEELLYALQDIADKRHTTVSDILRRFIKIGLIADQIQEIPGAALIIREGDSEREILLI